MTDSDKENYVLIFPYQNQIDKKDMLKCIMLPLRLEYELQAIHLNEFTSSFV